MSDLAFLLSTCFLVFPRFSFQLATSPRFSGWETRKLCLAMVRRLCGSLSLDVVQFGKRKAWIPVFKELVICCGARDGCYELLSSARSRRLFGQGLYLLGGYDGFV